jgi:hypothetical protein
MDSGENSADRARLGCLQVCDLVPHLYGGGPEFAVIVGWKHVENEGILIDNTPQPVFLAANADDDLIEVPFAAKPSC